MADGEAAPGTDMKGEDAATNGDVAAAEADALAAFATGMSSAAADRLLVTTTSIMAWKETTSQLRRQLWNWYEQGE